jgi:hypothetical protein
MLTSVIAAQGGSFDSIVYIGAGSGDDLPLKDHVFRQLILVEPHPERAAGLRKLITNVPGAQVIEAAVSSTNGEGDLILYNFPEMDSLRPPTGVHQLYPGLRRVGEIRVSTVRPEALINQISLAEGARNLLVIGASSETLVIIDALEVTGLLGLFERIVAAATNIELHEGGSSFAVIKAWSEDRQYQLIASPDADDPDVYRVELKPAKLAHENRALRAEIAAAAETAAARRNEIDELKGQLRKVCSEGTALQETLTNIRTELEKKESDATAAEKMRAAQRKEIEDLQKNLTELKEAVRQGRAELDKKEKAVMGAIEAQKEAAALVNAREEELETLRDNLHVALRAQLIAQSDLKDLQNRYENLYSEKKAADELLISIGERLVHALADPEPEAITDNTTPSPNLALPKRSPRSRRRKRT